MAQDKDKIQQAANALDALGAADSQAEPPAQPGAPQEPAPVQPPARPVAPAPPAAKSAAPDPSLVRVVLKTPGKAQPPPKPDKPKKIEPPPPPLTPLARATLARKMAMRRMFIPLLLTTGLIMVLLGSWAVLVLAAGTDPLKGEITFQTLFLAKLMLLAWPIALILLGGTAFLMYEVHSHYTMYPDREAPRPAPKV